MVCKGSEVIFDTARLLLALTITPNMVIPTDIFFQVISKVSASWNFDFRDKIDRTGVDLEKYCENQKSGSVVTSAALVRFRKI